MLSLHDAASAHLNERGGEDHTWRRLGEDAGKAKQIVRQSDGSRNGACAEAQWLLRPFYLAAREALREPTEMRGGDHFEDVGLIVVAPGRSIIVDDFSFCAKACDQAL